MNSAILHLLFYILLVVLIVVLTCFAVRENERGVPATSEQKAKAVSLYEQSQDLLIRKHEEVFKKDWDTVFINCPSRQKKDALNLLKILEKDNKSLIEFLPRSPKEVDINALNGHIATLERSSLNFTQFIESLITINNNEGKELTITINQISIDVREVREYAKIAKGE